MLWLVGVETIRCPAVLCFKPPLGSFRTPFEAGFIAPQQLQTALVLLRQIGTKSLQPGFRNPVEILLRREAIAAD